VDDLQYTHCLIDRFDDSAAAGKAAGESRKPRMLKRQITNAPLREDGKLDDNSREHAEHGD